MRGILLSFLLTVVAQAQVVKIMPLGDSLTAGGYNIDKVWHVDGGYREHLWQMFQNAKLEVDFVGRLAHGNFPDPQHEGYSGWKIHEVAAVTEEALKISQPDVVLLILGGNDLFRNYEIKTAPERFRDLIVKILETQPNVKLFVSSGITTNNFIFNRRIKRFNKSISRYVGKLQKSYKNLYWVDMYNESQIAGNTEDLTDGVHPTYSGYRKMAKVWFRALTDSGIFSTFSSSSSDWRNLQ